MGKKEGFWQLVATSQALETHHHSSFRLSSNRDILLLRISLWPEVERFRERLRLRGFIGLHALFAAAERGRSPDAARRNGEGHNLTLSDRPGA